MVAKPVRILSVAGSDSGGGAGIQADIKTITALGGYAMTALTAITVQNTKGVTGIHRVPEDIVAGQIAAVCSDLGVDAIKTGMLPDAAMIACVFDALDAHAPDTLRVIDPVMVATSGDRLMDEAALDALVDKALPGAIVTPNIPEAEILTGRTIREPDEAMEAAFVIAGMGCRGVVVKGGHLDTDGIMNCVVDETGAGYWAHGPRVDSRNTHGTGCTMASALAVLLAQGLDLLEAVGVASEFIVHAIAAAPGYGSGAGPLNHGFAVPQPTDPEE